MITDESLYEKLKAGDLSAFDRLYERHHLSLFRFILSYVKNREEAEEVLHEAFLKMITSENLSFTGAYQKVQSWLYVVARNLSLNRLRHKKLNCVASGDVTCASPADQNDERRHQELAAALERLPPHLRRMAELRLSGLSNQDISKDLGIPVGTVKSRFHALIQILREELE